MVDSNTTRDNLVSQPAWLPGLEQCFGPASQAGFGSAVFFQPGEGDSAPRLEDFGRAKYQYFCGENWDRFGPENWLSTWKRVFVRPNRATPDVLAELSNLADPLVRQSAVMLWDAHADPAQAQQALREAFDRSAPEQFQVFQIGDGQAMSGILLVAGFADSDRVALILLMD